jgi:hypothetical protein
MDHAGAYDLVMSIASGEEKDLPKAAALLAEAG